MSETTIDGQTRHPAAKKIQVYKRVLFKDQQVDLTETLMGRSPRDLSRPTLIPISDSSHLDVPISEFVPDSKLTMQFLRVDYDMIGNNVPQQRVVKTEQWGDTTIEFIETWTIRYFWFAPTMVNGQRAVGE